MFQIGSLLLALFLVFQGHVALGEETAPVQSKSAGNGVISGEVAYSDPNAKGRNHQLEAQDSLEVWIHQAEAVAKSGGEGNVGELAPEIASYLSVLYFYCTLRDGPCPFVLESILDVEILRARASKEISCSSMQRFFKSYLKHGLDDRGKFLYPLTRGLEMANFNEGSRPRFLECKETVAAMLNDKEIMAQRFGEKGEALGSLSKLADLVSQVKNNKTDIYVATGLRDSEE
jgi:hypothetical protein